MITVIDEPRDNIFEGMSMTDALDNAVVGVYEICNDFMMDSLLTEHAYLYENATEITYINEDGSDNANGKSLKEKFIGMIQNVTRIISDLFDKLISTITEKTLNFKRKLSSIGMNEKKISEAINYVANNSVSLDIRLNGWSTSTMLDYIISETNNALIDKSKIESETQFYNQGDFFKVLEKYATEKGGGSIFSGKGKFSAHLFENAKKAVLDKDTIQTIKTAKNNAIKSLNEYKKGLDKRGAEYQALFGKATSAIKSNTAVWKDAIKGFNMYYFENAKLINMLVKMYNKANADDAKRKAKQAVEDTTGKIKDSVNDTKQNIKRGVGQAAINTGNKLFRKGYDLKYGKDED